MTNQNFLGRGWTFPPTFDRRSGEVEMLSAEADIRSSIEIILTTQVGERVLRPDFGWQRDQWLFTSLTTTAATTIEREIRTALLYFEPRIDLNQVTLRLPDPGVGRVEVSIDYTVRQTNTRNNLVFPFYLTEV